MRNNKYHKIQKDRKNGSILGIYVSGRRREEVLREIVFRLNKKSYFYITTPNPEIILGSLTNSRLKDVLNQAHISLNDGTGLAWARFYLNLSNLKNNYLNFLYCFGQLLASSIIFILRKEKLSHELPIIKGRELFDDLIVLASAKRWRVYLLGGKPDVSQKLATKLKQSHKKLVVKASSGPRLDKNLKPTDKIQEAVLQDTLDDIRKFAPHLLFIGFGSPKQELFVAKYFDAKLAKCLMTVGGTFDSSLEKSKIVNSFAKLNLEWLGRLIRFPQRLPRIFRATVIFPLLVFRFKLTQSK